MPDAPPPGAGSPRSPRPDPRRRFEASAEPPSEGPAAPATPAGPGDRAGDRAGVRRRSGGRAGSPPSELSAVGRLIDAARRERGLTLLQLSARIGVTRQFLYRLLRAEDAPAGALRDRLEQLLRVRLPDGERRP